MRRFEPIYYVLVNDTMFVSMQLPSSLTFEQGASIPAVLTTAVTGLYGGKIPTGELRGAGLTPPWAEGGHGKYAGTPILVLGGASSVGQQGMFNCSLLLIKRAYTDLTMQSFS